LRFSYEVSKRLDKELEKLQKKNIKRFEIILKKMGDIINDPYHYKPLQHDMKGLRRVHIDKSFVLIFEINESENKVIFWDIDHHDNIY
jgi:YafQ family addiction module toxin component